MKAAARRIEIQLVAVERHQVVQLQRCPRLLDASPARVARGQIGVAKARIEGHLEHEQVDARVLVFRGASAIGT
jgi:hypothetical protein